MEKTQRAEFGGLSMQGFWCSSPHRVMCHFLQYTMCDNKHRGLLPKEAHLSR
jgi:hypothetical protein